ncbi:MAG: glycosyltransferase family 4 protein [Actinomycetota bacterium]
MTKIAYIIRPAEGGMLKHLLDLLRLIDRSRFKPIVLSPPGNNLTKPLGELDVELIEVAIADKPSLARDVGSVAKLATALTATGPGLIHVHSNKAALLTEMAARRAGMTTPIVFSMHNFPSYMSSGGLKKVAASLAMRRIINRAERLIVVSESLKRFMVDKEKADPEKISVIHNGLDFSAWQKRLAAADAADLRAVLGIPANDFVVGTLGRLIPSKGHDILINAMPELVHKFPGIRLVIAGSGPLDRRLKEQTATLGLDGSVVFPGHVDDPAPYYKMFDAFVMPTVMESFGLAVIEAMTAGCPVAASRTGGLPEIIENRETGLLFTPGDSRAVAAAIRTIAADKKAARQLGEAGRRSVKERFTLDAMVAETEKVYEKAAGPQAVN